MISFFYLVLLVPLLTFINLLTLGSFWGGPGAMFFSVLNVVMAFIFSIFLYFDVSFDFILVKDMWNWVNIDSFSVFFTLRYDSLTAIMFIVVTLVSGCVNIYSCVYMFTEPYVVRFMSYLSLFTFFMLLLVSAGNLLVLFLGWEGVGVCSYLLIGFWSTRAQAGKAATKAFLVNKVGDLFFLTGIALAFLTLYSTDFSVISCLIPYSPTIIAESIALFLVLGAVGKSAQIGLHTWLPDAMEGPTPVSALIHAATMVTAGVFLLIRCSTILEFAPRILYLVMFWGGLTAFVASLIGIAQNDIKKIIAYSTCSQLGYMAASIGLFSFNLSLFHLLNHAFFKALLFLGAGSVIHFLSGEQDTRKMGGLAKIMPFTYVCLFIASLSLTGFPFLSGFYSKDLIIETSFSKMWVSSHFIYWLLLSAASLTMAYSLKLLERSFWSSFSGHKMTLFKSVQLSRLELAVFSCLSILGLISGYYLKDVFSGLGSNYFSQFFGSLPKSGSLAELEFICKEVKVIPCIFLITAFEVESRFFECKWFFNECINGYFVFPSLFLSRHLFEQIEKGHLEKNGPLLVYTLAQTKVNNVF